MIKWLPRHLKEAHEIDALKSVLSSSDLAELTLFRYSWSRDEMLRWYRKSMDLKLKEDNPDVESLVLLHRRLLPSGVMERIISQVNVLFAENLAENLAEHLVEHNRRSKTRNS